MVIDADQLPAFVLRHKLAFDSASTLWGQGLSCHLGGVSHNGSL